MKEHSKRPYTVYEADEDAVYDEEYTIDLSTLKVNRCIPASAGKHTVPSMRSTGDVEDRSGL